MHFKIYFSLLLLSVVALSIFIATQSDFTVEEAKLSNHHDHLCITT
jgi:hypothetical protein